MAGAGPAAKPAAAAASPRAQRSDFCRPGRPAPRPIAMPTKHSLTTMAAAVNVKLQMLEAIMLASWGAGVARAGSASLRRPKCRFKVISQRYIKSAAEQARSARAARPA